MNVLLIALFIIMPIVGGVIGKIVSPYRQNYTLLGAVLGLVAVIIFEFLIIPPVFVLFEINENLKKSKENKKSEDSRDIEFEQPSKVEIKKKEITDERIAQAQKDGCWICMKCGEENPNMREVCSNCGAEADNGWECPFCGAHNTATTTMCIACFKPKPQ